MPKKQSQEQYPGWMFLVAGLFIGLFIAFLFFLQQQPAEETTAKEALASTKAKLEALREEQIQKNQTEDKQDNTPTFDFYNILPELEVVIPNFNNDEKPKQQASDSQADNVITDNEVQIDYLLQVGSFSNQQQAEQFKAKIAFLGLQAFLEPVSINGKQWHRVRLGPYQNKEDLVQDQQRLAEDKIKSIVLQIKP